MFFKNFYYAKIFKLNYFLYSWEKWPDIYLFKAGCGVKR